MDPQARLPDLERALEEAQGEQIDAERNQRILTPLSEERIKALRDEVRAEVERVDGLKQVFEDAARITIDEHCPDADLLQTTMWTARGAFTDLPGWLTLGGWQVGHEPMHARRNAFFEGMLQSERLEHDSIAMLWDDVANAITSMELGANDRVLIVFRGDWSLYRSGDARFQLSWTLGEHALKGSVGFEGQFSGWPLFHFMDDEHREVMICVVERHGHFRDCALPSGESVDVDVVGFNREEAREVLRNSGPLMRSGSPLGEEEAITEIMDRVLIRVIFGVHYEVDDPESGVVIGYPVQIPRVANAPAPP